MKESERGDFKRFIWSEIFYTRRCVVRDIYVYELSAEFQFRTETIIICVTRHRTGFVHRYQLDGRQVYCSRRHWDLRHTEHIRNSLLIFFLSVKKGNESRWIDNNDEDDSCSHAYLIRATFSIHLLRHTSAWRVMRLVRCHVRSIFLTKIDFFLEFMRRFIAGHSDGANCHSCSSFLFALPWMKLLVFILWFNLRTNPAIRRITGSPNHQINHRVCPFVPFNWLLLATMDSSTRIK